MKSGPNYRSILLLIVLCLISYSRTLDVPFTLDDLSCVATNPFIRDFSNYFDRMAIEKTFSMSPGVFEDTRNSFITRPLSYLTFSLNYYIHGYSLAGYHVVNTLIHTINAVLVFLLVQAIIMHVLISKTELDPERPTSQWNPHIAFLTAALFAVHPLMTSAVTYIIQRMTSLVALFYLTSILLYVRHASTQIKTRKYAWYALSLVFCTAAMLTKESAFTLPMTLLLYELSFCRGDIRRRLIKLTPFLMTMTIIPYNVIGLQNSATAKASGMLSNSLNVINFNHVSSWEYLLTQCRAVAFYLRLLVLPFGLSLEHDFPVSRTLADIGVIFSACLHLLILGYGIYLIVRSSKSEQPGIIDKLSGFGIVWFYLTLSVESSAIPMNEMAVEYRTYLPSIGIFLFIVCRVQMFLGGVGNVTGWKRTYFLWGPVLCVLLSLTVARNEVWRNPELFWSQTVDQYPKRGRAYTILADYYISRGELTKAAQVYFSAIQQMPDEAVFHCELGVVHILSNNYEAAVPSLARAVMINPDLQRAYEYLAQAYSNLGQRELASEMINRLEGMRRGK